MVHRPKKWLVCGFVKFLPAILWLCCLALPGSFLNMFCTPFFRALYKLHIILKVHGNGKRLEGIFGLRQQALNSYHTVRENCNSLVDKSNWTTKTEWSQNSGSSFHFHLPRVIDEGDGMGLNGAAFVVAMSVRTRVWFGRPGRRCSVPIDSDSDSAWRELRRGNGGERGVKRLHF